MSETLSEAVVEVAEEAEIDKESKTFEDIRNKVENIEEKIETMGNCEHENIDFNLPSSMFKKNAFRFLSDEDGEIGETTVALGAECEECEKNIDVSLNLEIERE